MDISKFPSDLQNLLQNAETSETTKILIKQEEILSDVKDIQTGINIIDADIKRSNDNDATTIDIITQLINNNNDLTRKLISFETKLNQYIMLRDMSIWRRIKYIFFGRV